MIDLKSHAMNPTLSNRRFFRNRLVSGLVLSQDLRWSALARPHPSHTRSAGTMNRLEAEVKAKRRRFNIIISVIAAPCRSQRSRAETTIRSDGLDQTTGFDHMEHRQQAII
jgi:hypothetical protein